MFEHIPKVMALARTERGTVCTFVYLLLKASLALINCVIILWVCRYDETRISSPVGS